MTALSRLSALGARARPTRATVALAWAAATLLVLVALAAGPGISRDEAAVLAALEGRAPAASAEGAPLRAPLAAQAAYATDAVLSRLGLSHLRAARAATALLGAALSAGLALLGWELGGLALALLAPALFWLAPRHLHAGLVATPDLALAALALAAVLAYRSSRRAQGAWRRRSAAVGAGVLLGGALAARPDAWVLLVALGVHAALSRRGPAADPPREGRPRAVPPALAAMAILGPILLAAAWPALWSASPGRIALAFAPGLAEPGGRGARPLLVAALTIPATLLWAYLAGVAHAAWRIARALRARTPADASDDLLLLLCAAVPLAAAAAGIAPAVAGVRPWLHAVPFLAALGGRALLRGASVAWPARARPLAASLALVVLYPGLRAAVHAYPAGASAWNELAGGAPGAAGLGLPSQDGGEAAAAVLEAINARARAGARVWWPGTGDAAVHIWSRDGRLRPDLALADGPGSADLAVVTLDGGSRDAEYRAWTAFRSARPVAGAYLDEVPLAFVYARPGAWR